MLMQAFEKRELNRSGYSVNALLRFPARAAPANIIQSFECHNAILTLINTSIPPAKDQHRII
jgi:hypothetical protein